MDLHRVWATIEASRLTVATVAGGATGGGATGGGAAGGCGVAGVATVAGVCPGSL